MDKIAIAVPIDGLRFAVLALAKRCLRIIVGRRSTKKRHFG